MIIDELIFDRTEEDVNRLKEFKSRIMKSGLSALTADEVDEYIGGMKGAYNASDLNRVGEAVAYLTDYLIASVDELDALREELDVASDVNRDLPYNREDVVTAPKTDWSMRDIPTQYQMERYLSDLSVLRSLMPLPENTPVVPNTLSGMTYITANGIEQMLYVLYQTVTKFVDKAEYLIRKTPLGYFYSDEVYGGETD